MKLNRVHMKWKLKSLGTVVISMAISGTALADTLVIKYASGEVQSVELLGHAKDIQDITVGETSVPLSEKLRTLLLGKQPASAGAKESSEAPKKSGPKLKWAPPVSE
ncbi:hypothetical protein M1B72_12735 [Geomonas paludis]|uniref:Uncharacterized protein n=1 Tax=Geomonas paludis TaxID=2740185 RepID=A0A6V8MYP1_9BACT|nr:hypothetical protein [Geomonas paludis]UPU34316.1 hypothetical protein M1B72_12735 [Geomonas paludis]GFO64299.1 hypothetical protein GMPD_22180 [Geomonas paludis]